jgi:hypothetical protein
VTTYGRVAACGLALALGACATANTAQQNLGYERWAKCAVAYVQLERIGVDGRITFEFSSSASRVQVVQCLAEAGRAGPPLPEPIAVGPRGGP